MSSVFDIAVSGLKAQSRRLSVSADNVVKAGDENFLLHAELHFARQVVTHRGLDRRKRQFGE